MRLKTSIIRSSREKISFRHELLLQAKEMYTSIKKTSFELTIKVGQGQSHHVVEKNGIK